MNPYLSIVVAARNDNYGGNFLQRMQLFVDNLLFQAERCALSGELVVVEWNPPVDRARLSQVLRWHQSHQTMTVRIIEVPPAIHQSLPNAARIGLFDCFAKNVGIRRARGEFILATNPDILFSNALIAYLGSRKLSARRLYRADRYDFRGELPVGLPPERALRRAMRTVYQVNIRGDNQTGLNISIGRVRRWCGLFFGSWPGSSSSFAGGRRSRDPITALDDDNGVFGGVYTNASGDFLLASADSWRAVRGFPEFTDTYTHLDSYGCHQLKALGLEQTLFLPPCMILHWDHPREEQKNRPVAPVEKWQDDLKKIRAGLLGPAINGDNWGLAGESLYEDVVGNGLSAV